MTVDVKLWKKQIEVPDRHDECYMLVQWSPTGVPRHTRVPWTGDRGAANFYDSSIFIPKKPARGAAKYL